MKNFILILVLIILASIMLGVVFFPIIIAFWTGNLFLMFLYAVWWIPILVTFYIIVIVGEIVIESL